MKNLLIVLSCILFSNSIHSEELNVQNKEEIINEVNYGYSGFATATMFSDKNWFQNTENVSVNLDLSYGEWSMHAQIAAPYVNPIRRFTIDKSFFKEIDGEVIVQVGRFPRLNSFYNTVTDSPGAFGFAMLPLGEYSRRVILNRTFNSLDGIRIKYINNNDFGLLKLTGNYGSIPVENQCLTQNETTRKQCTEDYKFVNAKGNYDLGFTFDKANITLTSFIGSINLGIKQKDNIVSIENTQTEKLKFDYFKTGVKYSTEKWWMQGEHVFINYQLADTNMPFTSVQKWKTYYLLAGYNWTDYFNTYVSYSKGSSNKSTMGNDKVIGATYINNDTTISVEYHKGSGSSWKKYFSPTDNWDAWVLSFTQRF